MALIDFGAIVKGATKGLLTTVEQGLIKLYDSNIAPVGKEWLKGEANKLIDSQYDKVFKGMHKTVRGWIDKIDGVEGNIPAMPDEAPAAPTPQAPAADIGAPPVPEPLNKPMTYEEKLAAVNGPKA